MCGHLTAMLPLACALIVGIVPAQFNYNPEIGAYTGFGQVFHGGAIMVPWSTPICAVAGIIAVYSSFKTRSKLTLLEAIWTISAAIGFYIQYALYLHFS
jgi:hypothetical protein